MTLCDYHCQNALPVPSINMDYWELKQARMAVNKQLNSSVRKKPQTTDLYLFVVDNPETGTDNASEKHTCWFVISVIWLAHVRITGCQGTLNVLSRKKEPQLEVTGFQRSLLIDSDCSMRHFKNNGITSLKIKSLLNTKTEIFECSYL